MNGKDAMDNLRYTNMLLSDIAFGGKFNKKNKTLRVINAICKWLFIIFVVVMAYGSYVR